MLKKFLSCTLIILVQMLCVGPLYAQSSTMKDEALIQKVKQDIGKLNSNGKNMSRVKLHNGTKLKGYISQANEDNFVITDKHGQKNTVAYTDVSQVKKGGGDFSKTSKILVVSGIAAGVVVTILAVSIARLGRGFRGGIGGF